MEPLPSNPPASELPLDDGRGLDEVWPWVRYDDFSPGIEWGSVALRFVVVAAAGMLLAAIASPGLLSFLAAILVATAVAVYKIFIDISDPWPEWRLRNLQAAEHRAYQAMKRVDPEFAEEMRRILPPIGLQPPPEILPADSREQPRRRSHLPPPPSTVPWRYTTGPTIPSDDLPPDGEDDLPF